MKIGCWFQVTLTPLIPTYNLGKICAVGEGVSQDWSEAYFWWSHSVQRDKGQASLRVKAAEHLTPDQMATVDKRVVEWTKGHPCSATPPGK